MALQLGALRDALIAAGAPPDKADKTAEEAATYESRLAKIETTLTLHSWMLGVIIAMLMTLLWRVFTHGF